MISRPRWEGIHVQAPSQGSWHASGPRQMSHGDLSSSPHGPLHGAVHSFPQGKDSEELAGTGSTP